MTRTRRSRVVLACFGLVALLVPGRAAAQSAVSPELTIDQPRRPVPPRRSPFTIGVRASFEGGVDQMLAANTFKALFGLPRLTTFGVGADVVLDRRYFVRISYQRETRNGTRVFVDDGQVFSTGVSLHLLLQPFEIGGGVRLASPMRPHRLVPYIGAALVAERFVERSPDDDATEDLPVWFRGAAVFAGLDVSLMRRISVGSEFEFRTLPNTIGTSDVSQAYGESNLGSFGARITVAFTFGRD